MEIRSVTAFSVVLCLLIVSIVSHYDQQLARALFVQLKESGQFG